MNDRSSDRQQIESLVDAQPNVAIDQLRRMLAANPLDVGAYRLLARTMQNAGHGNGSRGGAVTSGPDALRQAQAALRTQDFDTAEMILRSFLRQHPTDTTGQRLLAELAVRLGYVDEANELLRYVLELDPGSVEATRDLAAVLLQLHQADEALPLIESVLERRPDDLAAIRLHAATLNQCGDAEEAIARYETYLSLSPKDPGAWSGYGQTLRTVGRIEDAIAALRRAVDLSPSRGALWWGLSDVKSVRLDDRDVGRMIEALDSRGATPDDQLYLHFALGKAHDDRGEYAKAFEHFWAGNELQASRLQYDPDGVTAYVDAAVDVFSAGTFQRPGGQGRNHGETDRPIFIVGMPRAGSTLVEQILGSHSQIEGTIELPALIELAEEISSDPATYAARVASLTEEAAGRVGEEYLTRASRYRQTAKPRFTDKMPNNWQHVPLIHLALPGAKIIDIRRNPLDCGISNFKQLFLGGQGFSNRLDRFGRYYADYVRFMDHIDQVLPGRVHRVIYEELVGDFERQVRAVLDYLEVEFEPACLSFFENDRAVRTPSADQVRQPINRKGIGAWKAYEPWLGPLKEALGAELNKQASA